MKLAVQCDFDGTIIEGEIRNLLLEEFADGNWREIVDAFYNGEISVKDCMKQCFSMVKTDEKTLREFILRSDLIKVRGGFIELYSYCKQKGYHFVIVSNGLNFYIDAILYDLGLRNIEVFAAQNQFSPDGMITKYIGPNGDEPETDFKEAFTELLEKQGYRVVCIGDSISDIFTAKRASHVFATGNLCSYCRKENLNYISFETFHDVIRGFKAIL